MHVKVPLGPISKVPNIQGAFQGPISKVSPRMRGPSHSRMLLAICEQGGAPM